MRGTVSPYRIRLKRKARKRLEGVTRRRKQSHYLVVRCRIVLLSDERWSVSDIAMELAIDEQVVRRWRVRYFKTGFDGLRDRCRSGRPSVIEPKVWEKVATLVVQPPEQFGLPLARWTIRELAIYLGKRFRWHVGRSSVGRFLKKMALHPHRIKYWLNPTDPDFDVKAAKICRLYLKPPPGVTVLSLDEKPGIQAKGRKHPTRLLGPRRETRVEFEYKRNGTRCLFAAFNVRTGKVVARVESNRKTPVVIAFLDLVCSIYRRGRIIIITDNINTRKGDEAKAWLRKHPRVSFVFTPFHGSWLNQVEIWFSILSNKCLKHRVFDSVRKLATGIMRFVRWWNAERAHPFKWTFSGKVLHA
jgi:transposase